VSHTVGTTKAKHDRQIARLLASGLTQSEVAKRLGVSRRTIERRYAVPRVRRLVASFRDAACAAGLGSLCRRFRRAVEVVGELMESANRWDGIRLQAASRIIESCLKAREQTDIAERLEELERLLVEVQSGKASNGP
jgi:transcriptional regulator with XRE-family HTH domain